MGTDPSLPRPNRLPDGSGWEIPISIEKDEAYQCHEPIVCELGTRERLHAFALAQVADPSLKIALFPLFERLHRRFHELHAFAPSRSPGSLLTTVRMEFKAERHAARLDSTEEPTLDEFDPDRGEIFATVDEEGNPDLGIAWVDGGNLRRATLSRQLRRIAKEAEVSASAGQRAREDAGAERDRATKRLVGSLPFARVKDSLWPLPTDPTLESTAQREARNGPLLAELRRYFEERVCTNDPDGHLVLALWALAASARSETIDFAPRLQIEAPFGWGKSTTAEAEQLVIPRAVYGAAVSPAAAHRVMNEWHPVLLVDESAVADNPELQRVLRAGFKRGARIMRAAQNQDRGVVMVDPFGFVILTTQIDTRDDLVNRCYVLYLSPGVPQKRVSHRDPAATELRTALVRLRLDILLAAEYADIGSVSQEAYATPGLEPRSRDKLGALWPFAKRYDVHERLAIAAARLEDEATQQLADSDKGLVATAIGNVVGAVGGLAKLKAADLDLARVQEQLEHLLIDIGEAIEVSVGPGETARRIDLRRYGPRDFTGRIVRELGLRVRPVMGKARIELRHFTQVWPSIASRYAGATTLDDFVGAPAPSGPAEGGSVMPPIPTSSVGSSRGLVGVSVGSSDAPPAGEESAELVGIGGVERGTPPPGPASDVAGQWANARCSSCPDCAAGHDDPGGCGCGLCSPWGHSTTATGNRSHFCGILPEPTRPPGRA